MAKRIAAIVLIYLFVLVGWLVLGGVTASRSAKTSRNLADQVAGLWGEPQRQPAPELTFTWEKTWVEKTQHIHPRTGRTTWVKLNKREWVTDSVLADSSQITVDFDLDHRKKGLLWYATYVVDFAGDYAYTHDRDHDGFLSITYRFPSGRASFDDFHFMIDGHEDGQQTPVTQGDEKVIVLRVPVKQGQRVPFSIAYRSRGLDDWRYTFGSSVNRVKGFSLTMNTNFAAIDFPDGSMSPTAKTATDVGWQLAWTFGNLISGFDIGMDMPQRLNPGPLAAQISFFAPLTLLYFFVWLFVITLLKKVDLHPMNYLFLSAAFFAFHLLLTYTVDHLDLVPAFVLSSVVSVFLVVTYLRLVVGLRFAAVEAGLAQIVYLVLFSYAHFYQGWTGLIVTGGSIVTLFMLMQLTGRIDWAKQFGGRGRA